MYWYAQNKQTDQPIVEQMLDWKTFAFATTTPSSQYYGDLVDVDFSFQYPPGWSVCKKDSLNDYEHVRVSDDCSSASGRPIATPENYFYVGKIGSLDFRARQSDSYKSDTGWETEQVNKALPYGDGFTTEPKASRIIYYQSKDIALVLVGLNPDTQSVLDKIASTFKFNQ